MKSAQARAERPRQAAPDEALEGASRFFKAVQLRLRMKEREDLAQQLVQLDFDIWALEEFFRTDGHP